jgi:hypothetical protein
MDYTQVRRLIAQELEARDTRIRQLQGAAAVLEGQVAALEAKKRVFGVVSSAGAIVHAGSGDWAVVRDGAGVYTVSFNPDFSVAPAVVVTCYLGVQRLSTLTSLAANGFQVTLSASAGGAGTDQGFAFVALGLPL